MEPDKFKGLEKDVGTR